MVPMNGNFFKHISTIQLFKKCCPKSFLSDVEQTYLRLSENSDNTDFNIV